MVSMPSMRPWNPNMENYEGTEPVLELTLGDLLDSIEFRYRLNRILKRMQEKCKEFAPSEDEEETDED